MTNSADSGSPSEDPQTIPVFLRPLALLELGEGLPSQDLGEFDAEAVLRFLCEPGVGHSVEDIKARNEVISREERQVFAVPAVDQILRRLVWPLRHAKGSFLVGNYLGTIALCGLVAEMLALLLRDMSHLSLNGKPMTVNDERRLFGSSFEKLGQERRVGVLHAYGIIDDETQSAFDAVRSIRRRYLHFLGTPDDDIVPDATNCYVNTVDLTMKIIAEQGFQEGRILLRRQVLDYMRKNLAT